MKQFLGLTILIAALLLFSSCAANGEKMSASPTPTVAATASTAGNAEQEIIQYEREWGSLNAKTGPAFMERLEAEEYLYTDGKGQAFTKAQDIAAFKAREVTESSRELKETKVHVYGDVAVITALSIDKSKDKNGSHDNASRFTDVFVKRNGEWKCVASHGSDLPKEKK